jgi:hypothetical protein
MHQIEIEVVGVEVFQRGVACLFHIVGVVAVVPELGGDEDFASRNAALLDALCAGRLSAIAVQ